MSKFELEMRKKETGPNRHTVYHKVYSGESILARTTMMQIAVADVDAVVAAAANNNME